MTDQMPKPTGLSKPTVGSDDFFNQDFSKFGQPAKNLEVGGGDLAVGFAGSAMRGTGTGIAEIGLSDLVRAGSALSDKLPGTQVLEYARRKLMGESEEEQAAKKADALDKITGAVTDPVDNAIIKPIVNPIGTAIKEGGETLIDRGTSEDYKEALRGREIFTGNGVSDFGISDSAGDPAVWAAKFTDGIGSLGGTLAVGALTGGTVKALVKKQMLKRGASMALADETARLAGIKWGQRGAMAEGVNMSTGQSADQARSQVDALSWDQLLTSKTFNDQVKEISSDPQFEGASATDLLNEAKRRTADYAASIAKSDPKTWAAAAAGTLLGDAALFKMLQGVGAKGAIKGLVQGAAGDTTGEVIEEGTQKYVGNEATNKAGGQQIDPWDGVAQAAATAGTIATLSGGSVGAIGGARGAYAPQDDQSAIGGEQSSDPQEALQASAVPEFDSALAEVNAIERKAYGQHSIGRDGNKFRGAYVDELGNVQITPAYSKIEDVRAAMGWPVHGQADNTGSQPAGRDDFANTPAFMRKDGDRFKGWAADSDVQRALAGEFGPSVQEIIAAQMRSGDQGKTMQERVLAGELGRDPFAGGKSAIQVGTENAPLRLPQKDIIFAGDANAKQPGSEVAPPGAFDDKQAGTGPQFRGSERTRWQDGQEGDVLPPEAAGNPSGYLPGRVIDGESREVGTELPHKPFIAGQDNRAAVSEEQRRQAEQSAMAERQQNQPKQIGQSDTIFAPGAPGADNKNSAYTPPRLSRDQVDSSLGEQSIRDPRTDAGQAIQQAGSESDAIFGQLKTLRITKRGKPFASQKEAQLASRKTETPIALPTGGFGVVDKAELEQVQASQVNHDSNEVPGSDVGNGFKAGAYKGSKYRVGTTNSTGAENGTPILEKRSPGGSASSFYVGKDGNLLDADNVVFNDQSSKERVWRPASKEQTAEAASILDEMGKLDLNDPKRAELKVKLKALVLGETTSTIKPSMQAEASPIEQPSSNAGQLDQAVSQEVTDGMPQQLPAPEAVRDETRQDGLLPDDGVAPTPTNTAPASDAGVAVSGAGEKRVTIEPLTDKSIIVKGDKNDTELKARVEAAWPKAPPLYNERHKGWVFSSKREGVVREALADLLPGDVAEQKAAPVGEVAPKESPAAVQKKPAMTNKLHAGKVDAAEEIEKINTPESDNSQQVSEPTPDQLADYGYLREHRGKWQSRSSQGGAWMTHNTRDGAIDQASKHHAYDISKGNPVQTRQERSEQGEKEFAERMDRRHGSKTIGELEGEVEKLSTKIVGLQRAGANEFNNGGRRTGAAVANEGARQAGQEKMDLERYIEMRKGRDPVTVAPPRPVSESEKKWSGAKTVADYRDGLRSLFSGDMDFAEFKAMSRHMLDNSAGIRAELEKKTKAELIAMMGATDAAMFKGEKKDAIVNRVHRSMISDLRWAANGDKAVMTTGVTELGGGNVTTEQRTATALEGLTEERYQQFRDKQISDRKALEERVKAIKKAIANPETLEEFGIFIERRGLDKLTPEQRSKYEDMVAASNLDRRDADKAARDEAKVTPTSSGDIIKTKHTKTGEDLFVIQMADRVDRDTYNSINAKAKEMGGWYSSFRGKGAVPGFQFKDETKAAEFREWLGGQSEARAEQSADAAPSQVTEPAPTDNKAKQIEALRIRAANIRAKAEAALNAERKENTSRRAGMADSARASAKRDLRFADLLDAIAEGIESGEITYLRNLSSATQLEQLQGALRSGLWNLTQSRRDALRAEGAITRDNDSREAWSDKATPEQQVEGVRMPGMDYHAENLRGLARKMQGKTGFKQAGAKIMALANAAVNRDSRTVTLSDPELIAKLKAFVNGSDDYSTSTIKDQIAGYGRLERMGITSQTELRAALRELIRLQKAVGKPATNPDPLTEKNRALKARLLNNRNAFIDFFPTPEEHAQDMAARAGIEPGMRVLEPSAGNGMLADAARAAGASVDAVELASDLRDILQTKGYQLVGTDFMATEAKGDYDAVIMNPPFSNDMDIDHVRHAYDHLKPGGRLVAIVSAMAGERSNRKNKAFSEWLESLGAEQEMMPEGAFKDSLNPTSVRTKIITIEKPESAQKTPTIKAGATATIYTPKGKPVQVQYRIVEAADLVASHEFDGTVNRNYPQTLQPRDRSKGTYQVQVRQIANNPEGERLGASPETDRGAPIVRDGIVESGNGRTIGIKQAYNNGTAGDYRAYLEDHAAEFGLDPAEVEAMQQPVLVRERLTEMDDAARRDFVVDSNTDAKMANSASEDAKADAGRLDDRLLGMLNIPEGGDVLAASNEPFLNAFARAIGNNILNQYKDDSGRWNDAYRRRVANAIFAYGYGSDALLKAATGDTDSTGKNITSSLMNNAAKMAELRNAAPEHAGDLVNIMAEAIGLMNDARRNGQSLQEVINQGDMLSGGVSHEGGALAEMLSDASRSAKRLTETVGAVLDMLNESARNAGHIDMLTGEPATTITAREAINAKAREYRIRKEREQQALRPSGDLFGLTGARDDNRQDAGVPGSAVRGETQGQQGQSDRLEVSGVSVTIPAIDEATQKDFNQANHRGAGRDFTSEIKTAAGRIINDLQSSGMLETREQKDLAAKLVQAWVDREVSSANKTMAFGIKNPSWLVTGRSGKSATNDAKLKVENDRLLAHDKSQDASVKRMKDELRELRSPEAKRAEQFKSEWKKARDIISELLSLFTQKKELLLSDFRKNYGPDLARHLESMQQANPDRFVEEINAQNKRLIDAGMNGLLDIVGPRSKAGKIIASVLKAPGAVFSLSDAAPGTRGMTKPELEMVATDWSKQYKGAASARIMVAANQAEMNEVLGMVGAAVPDGQTVNAAYLPGYKTLLLNAEAIQSPKRARELMRHELLAHHGLREVVGDDAYISIIEAVKRGKDIRGIKDAYYQVAQNYTDMHPDVQAEEVFAHWMETQPDRGELAIWWRGIVRRVKDALRAVGLVGERTTEEEFNRVLDAIATGMRNGRQPGRRVMESWHDAPAYSMRRDPFKPDTFDARAFADEVDAVYRSGTSTRHQLRIGDTPSIYVRLGAKNHELVMPASVVKKATNPADRSHNVAIEDIKRLPQLLSDPLAVMKSATENNALVSLVEALDMNNKPVIVAIHMDAKGDGFSEVNKVASVYGKDEVAALQRLLDNNLVYLNKEKAAWFHAAGLQLPGANYHGGLSKSVLTKDDIRNSGALFSLGSAAVGDHLSSAEHKLNLVPPADIIDRTKSRINTLRQADKQQVKTWWSELVHKANTQVLDRLAPLKYAEELAGKSDASDSGYVAARLATGSASTMQASLLYGLPEWKDGVIQKKAGTGESDALLGIFEGLGKDLHNWLGWMAGHRAEQLMAEGRENLLTKEEIDALKQLNHGKEAAFNEAKKKWIALNKAVLDLGQEAGLFTAEDRSGWENEWYIPFFRESEDGDVAAPFKTKGIANQTAGIKKLKGGTANVNDLLENIFTTTGKMIDAAMKNMAAQKVVWNLADTDLIDVIAKPNLMDMRAANNPSNQMMWVKIDGENYLLKVNEPDLFRAMTMIDQKNDRGPAMQLAMNAKHLLTAGVTASPEFMLRNFLRDAVSAWAINDDGFRPLIDSVRGVRKTLKMNGGSIDMMFSGASFLGGYVNGNNPEAMASSVRKALRAKGMTPEQIERYEKSLIRNGKQALDVLGHYWRKYERFGEAIENGSREAVYEAAIKAGKSHAQAAFEAKDLMDFSMVGSSKLMQFLVDVLPFFNARMQGLGKLGRAIRNNPRQIAMRGGMIAAASLALLAMNWDDDRYDDLPDWDKDLNWHFWFGDDHYRIPKPFEIGLIFGTLPERMTRAMGGKDTAGKFGEVVARNMLETFSINPIPQVVKPLSEAYFNYDPFRGGPIDDMSDMNVLPEARYDERTSLLMRELGELTGFSPKKLQHIVEGYTGTIGAYVLAAGDGVTRMLGDYSETPSMRADEIPLLRTVYQGSAPARSSQAMTDFYKMMEEVNELHSTINQYRKEGRYEEATELAVENRSTLAKRQALTSAQKQFRALRNDMELIRRSKELTADEKRTRINNMLARRNNLAARMIRRFEEQ